MKSIPLQKVNGLALSIIEVENGFLVLDNEYEITRGGMESKHARVARSPEEIPQIVGEFLADKKKAVKAEQAMEEARAAAEKARQ